ncbi:MAG: fumarylacetoacetate hydrolase family protein [Chloroflexi bacterium]|nr:fumarylacetoacetate hydrolase family protein [Chloroflexota bacterium]
MKLVTFVAPSGGADPRAGVLHEEYVLDIALALDVARGRYRMPLPQEFERLSVTPSTVQEILNLGSDALGGLERTLQALVQRRAADLAAEEWAVRLGDVSLKAPLPEPRSLRDFFAFEDHVRRARARLGLEMVPEWYEFPVFYFSNTSAIFGPGETIPYPSSTQALDYELEVACVIGKAGIDIRESEAEEYIGGYMIMNDWSARDVQQKEMRVGLGPAKGKDFATSLGPYLVTPDELLPRKEPSGRYDLEMVALVNGTLYSRGNLRDIYWTFGQMIVRASQDVYLCPGDVIGSGTVGTGCILELGADEHGWLKPGDKVELEVGSLGRLCNIVGAPRKAR